MLGHKDPQQSFADLEAANTRAANKIFEIDEHIVASAAGILSDIRMLIEQAQLLAQQNQIARHIFFIAR